MAEDAAFVTNLRADIMLNPSAWENATLEAYLEDLSAFLNDTKLNEEPKWRTMAKILLAARKYE